MTIKVTYFVMRSLNNDGEIKAPTPSPPRRSSQPWHFRCIRKELSRSFSNIADGLRLAHAHTMAVAGVPFHSPPKRRGTSFHGRGIARPQDSSASSSSFQPKSCPHISNHHRRSSCSYSPRHLNPIKDAKKLVKSIGSRPLVALAALSPRPSPRNLPGPLLYRSSLSRSNPNLSSGSSCTSSSIASYDSQLRLPNNTDEEDKATTSTWDIASSSYSLHQQEETSDPFPLLRLPELKNTSLERPLPVSNNVQISNNDKNNQCTYSTEPLSATDKSSVPSTEQEDLPTNTSSRYNSYRNLDHQDSPPPVHSPSLVHSHQMRPLHFSSEFYLDNCASPSTGPHPLPITSPNPSICSLPIHSNKSRPQFYHLRYLHHDHNIFPSISRFFSCGLFPGALEWDSSSVGEGVGGEPSLAPQTTTLQSPISPSSPSRLGCDPSNPVLSLSLR